MGGGGGGGTIVHFAVLIMVSNLEIKQKTEKREKGYCQQAGSIFLNIFRSSFLNLFRSFLESFLVFSQNETYLNLQKQQQHTKMLFNLLIAQ